jgi:response regulator of citrate/malate metabolism
MEDGLDVIILDDDPEISSGMAETIRRFYSWGQVVAFDDPDQALAYCLSHEVGLAIFIIDVFLGDRSGFFFLDAVEHKFPYAHGDAIMITGNATDDVVNMCVASDVYYLLEKPVRNYALQLAVRSIVAKYMNYSKRLKQHPGIARKIARIEQVLSEP